MKKIIFAFMLLLSICLSSCSIYEDVYFKKDGKISYQMKFDASEMLAIMPNMMSSSDTKIPKDSLISFKDIIQEKVDLTTLSDKDKEDINNLSNLFLRIQSNNEKQEFTISIFGDFDNTEALNRTFEAMNRQQAKTKGQTAGDMPLKIDKILNPAILSWDGKKMTRKIILNKESKEEEDENDLDMEDGMSKFFSRGKMIVRYHFPNKIKSISDPNAMMSQNQKTVIIEYSATKFTDPDDGLNVEIKTE